MLVRGKMWGDNEGGWVQMTEATNRVLVQKPQWYFSTELYIYRDVYNTFPTFNI